MTSCSRFWLLQSYKLWSSRDTFTI